MAIGHALGDDTAKDVPTWIGTTHDLEAMHEYRSSHLKPQDSKHWHEEVLAWIDRFAKK